MAEEARYKGIVAFAAGKHAQAVSYYNEAIALSPDNYIYYSDRSAAHAGLKQYTEALSDAQKIIELKRDWATGYCRLGAAYEGLCNYMGALDAYNKGLELDRDNELLQSHKRGVCIALANAADVTLGFLSEVEERCWLVRQCFPSKAGGLPAWLDPIDLPSGKSCLCDICGEPLQFLLQHTFPRGYKESTYHRSLFVFMCQSVNCLLQDRHKQWKLQNGKASRSVKVFRCQLANLNTFYSSERPRYDGTDKPSGTGAPLCSWCGTWKGDNVCSGCSRARYCSDKHQDLHWKSSHDIECLQWSFSSKSSTSKSCPTGSSADMQKAASKSTWPEYGIVVKVEPRTEDSGQADETPKSVRVNLEDESFAIFQKRMASNSEEVLRYCEFDVVAERFWPMSSGRLSEIDIPKCTHCGASRSFEFQILPKLFKFLVVEHAVGLLDLATINVYSCDDSCEVGKAYKEEFVWFQRASHQSSTTY